VCIATFSAAINCLVADGKKFAHPLHHLGKRESDLPLIAIDSFRHMYLFPNTNDMTHPGKLRQFVLDLHSGKLHREFHHGPDPVVQQVTVQPDEIVRYQKYIQSGIPPGFCMRIGFLGECAEKKGPLGVCAEREGKAFLGECAERKI
ncbi:hypothetical protein COOONC_26082, partial [Cooperia oncophora]